MFYCYTLPITHILYIIIDPIKNITKKQNKYGQTYFQVPTAGAPTTLLA